MPDRHLALVEITTLALEAGLPLDAAEPGLRHWLEASPGAGPVPAYFTRALWEALGGPAGDQAGYRRAALDVLAAARAALAARIIAQNAWRTWLTAQWPASAAPRQLWLIVDHGYSDGLAIGFGPGDFW